jgi:hypothetical protein
MLDNEPRAHLGYALTVGGRTRLGTTNADGMLVEPVPAGATLATLRLEVDGVKKDYELAISHLESADRASG